MNTVPAPGWKSMSISPIGRCAVWGVCFYLISRDFDFVFTYIIVDRSIVIFYKKVTDNLKFTIILCNYIHHGSSWRLKCSPKRNNKGDEINQIKEKRLKRLKFFFTISPFLIKIYLNVLVFYLTNLCITLLKIGIHKY